MPKRREGAMHALASGSKLVSPLWYCAAYGELLERMQRIPVTHRKCYRHNSGGKQSRRYFDNVSVNCVNRGLLMLILHLARI
jgi:hypothetical protein